MAKKIIHLAPDEKFIDAAYEIYEQAFPDDNLFFILKKGNAKPEYVSVDKEYVFVDSDKDIHEQINRYSLNAKVVVFHGLNLLQAKVALKIDKEIKKVWTVFGYEVYSNHMITNLKLYGPLTTAKFKNKLDIVKDLLRIPQSRLFKFEKHPDEIVLKALKSMDLIALLYPEEVEFYRELKILPEDISNFCYTYYPLGRIVKEEGLLITETNILIGNSAFPSGNHLEVFGLLEDKVMDNRSLIVPLSYGRERYRDYIMQIGRETFEENFYPLLEFLPLTKYQELTQSCGIVIMNSYRQQGVGNVVDMLHRGAKVFLSKKNTFYHYLKRIGCHVYTVEDDLKKDDLGLLGKEKQLHNREIIASVLSMDRIIAEMRESLSNLLKGA